MTARPDPHFFETEADRAFRESDDGHPFFRGLFFALAIESVGMLVILASWLWMR